MGFFSKFEGKMEDAVEGAAEKVGGSSITPVQIAKKAEKQMRREKMVGAGKQFAPTLYTVLISPEDDRNLFNYYPTLAGETETYLAARAADAGLTMDGNPLVRFLPDPELKRGKFDVVAELVTSQIVERLRADEMQRYGIEPPLAAGPARMRPVVQRAARPATPHVGSHAAAHAAGAAATGMADGASAGAGNYPIPDIYQEQDNFEQADLSGFNEDIDISADNQPSSAGAQACNVDEKTQMFNPQAGAFTQIEGFDQPPALDVYLYDAMRDVAYTLTGQPERIGREEGNEIVVPDINASRVHAEIRMEPDGSWVIADLASTNGLYINGRKIKSAPLRDADIITIGTTELEFQQLA